MAISNWRLANRQNPKSKIMPQNIAIIPARGGSKRIPRKNIRPFLGKPIIAYSIETALNSDLFEEVMVSTDDDEIIEVAKEYGASVPFKRSADSADDYATLADVVNEVTKAYKNEGKHFDYGCCILPTSPLIKIENFKKALELLQNDDYDSVIPIVPFSYPIQRALKFYNGFVEMFNPENKRKRSQDLETAYHDAGQFYWFQFDKGMHSERKGAIILSDYEVQDIDDEEDWKLAELKYSLNDEK